MVIQNRPLMQTEKDRLHPNEVMIITHYEQTCGRPFMRFEMLSLKKMIQIATPAQICAVIDQTQKKYPERFLTFDYIFPIVKNYFSFRRGTHA